MPTHPLHPCGIARCPNLTTARYCQAHEQRGLEQARAVDRKRGTARQRGYDSKWEEARAGFLKKHPRCECPEHRGQPDAPLATVVDHIVPHRQDYALFWMRSNWQAMAAPCHNRKTATEDGGFGRARKQRGEVRVDTSPGPQPAVTLV